jgi:hypothetical protein
VYDIDTVYGIDYSKGFIKEAKYFFERLGFDPNKLACMRVGKSYADFIMNKNLSEKNDETYIFVGENSKAIWEEAWQTCDVFYYNNLVIDKGIKDKAPSCGTEVLRKFLEKGSGTLITTYELKDVVLKPFVGRIYGVKSPSLKNYEPLNTYPGAKEYYVHVYKFVDNSYTIICKGNVITIYHPNPMPEIRREGMQTRPDRKPRDIINIAK